MSTISHPDFLATLRERFGPNPADWAFICPACGDIATGADLRQALVDNPRERRGKAVVASDILGQECIGRTLGALNGKPGEWKGRGCDWAAYGLIGGPLVVEVDGRQVRSFNIADVADGRERVLA